jgi:hypothetical protein
MGNHVVDLTGKRFGRWLVIQRDGYTSNQQVRWLCQCDCGKQRKVAGYSLRNGISLSCGCGIWINRTHPIPKLVNLDRVRMKGLLAAIKARCYNPYSKSYKYYGKRGIKVCERWQHLQNFITDMGICPKGLTIERLNNNGDYEPSNCVWATRKQQQNNRTDNHWLTIGNETKTQQQWSEISGIEASTIYYRLDYMNPRDAVFTPLMRVKNKSNPLIELEIVK